jgi:hypothetical protein
MFVIRRSFSPQHFNTMVKMLINNRKAGFPTVYTTSNIAPPFLLKEEPESVSKLSSRLEKHHRWNFNRSNNRFLVFLWSRTVISFFERVSFSFNNVFTVLNSSKVTPWQNHYRHRIFHNYSILPPHSQNQVHSQNFSSSSEFVIRLSSSISISKLSL